MWLLTFSTFILRIVADTTQWNILKFGDFFFFTFVKCVRRETDYKRAQQNYGDNIKCQVSEEGQIILSDRSPPLFGGANMENMEKLVRKLSQLYLVICLLNKINIKCWIHIFHCFYSVLMSFIMLLMFVGVVVLCKLLAVCSLRT